MMDDAESFKKFLRENHPNLTFCPYDEKHHLCEADDCTTCIFYLIAKKEALT